MGWKREEPKKYGGCPNIYEVMDIIEKRNLNNEKGKMIYEDIHERIKSLRARKEILKKKMDAFIGNIRGLHGIGFDKSADSFMDIVNEHLDILELMFEDAEKHLDVNTFKIPII